jgi:hypothetical protein
MNSSETDVVLALQAPRLLVYYHPLLLLRMVYREGL